MNILNYLTTCSNPDRPAPSPSYFVQPKLHIHDTGDQYEKEANAVADKMVRMEKPLVTRLPITSVQRKCADCEEEENKVQRKQSKTSGQGDGSSLDSYIGGLSGGQALPGELRNFYEVTMGRDFSDVKVHTDAAAAKSAQSINALAYTSRNNIVFNEGQYNPHSPGGKHLLAHELTHVVQQRSIGNGSVMKQPDDKKSGNTTIIDELKKNPLFKKLPKSAQDKIIEKLESAPEEIIQNVAEEVIDLLNVDDNMKEGLKKAVEAIIDELKGKPKPFNFCDIPPFFRPGQSRDFKGMCCMPGPESQQSCCPPHRMSVLEARCCLDSEVLSEGKCVKRSQIIIPFPCSGNKPRTLDGKCCFPPQISNGITCVDPPGPGPKPPPPQPQPVVATTSNIGFNKDAPQKWYAPEVSFKASVTKTGQAEFKSLVEFLKANPSTSVQIQGHASSEKPKDVPDYNQKLTDRRVKLIMSELQKNIDANRFKNVPDDPTNVGCIELAVGAQSCGDIQAQKTVEASDRNVTVKVFEVK